MPPHKITGKQGGSIELLGLNVVGSSTKGKNHSIDMYKIIGEREEEGEEDSDNYSSDEYHSNKAKVGDQSSILD